MTTPVTRSAPSEQTDGGFTHRQILTILVGLMMGMFLAALDQTIVATAIRTIADDLHGFSLQAWATTAFLITSTISTPLYGKLSDIYGRKPFFLFAIAIFIVGSALCGLSQIDVRAGRVPRRPGHRRRRPDVAGAGDHRRHRAAPGAGHATRATSWPSSARPACSARCSAASSPAPTRSSASPAGAGSSTSTCRSGCVALVVVTRVLHIPHTRTRPPHRLARRDRADRRPGAAAHRRRAGPRLGLGLRPRRSPATCIGVVGLVAFVLAERAYGDEALLPLRLFRSRTFAVGSVSPASSSAWRMFGGLLTLPLYLQIVKGAVADQGRPAS